jgi:hypothetical protein
VRRPLRAGVALLTAFWSTGCHRYVPVELSALQPGAEVRLFMSRAAAAALPEEVPVNDLYLRGRLIGQTGDSVLMGIPIPPQPGFVGPDIRQQVSVGSAQIVDVQMREFSTGRTALAVAAAAGAVAAAISLIFGAESSVDVGDPNEDTSRVPVLSIPLRLGR